MNWLSAHILEVIGVLLILLVYNVWTLVKGRPWRRQLRVWLMLAVILGYPLEQTWVLGGVEPPVDKPYIMQMPRPTENMTCFVNTITNKIDSCRLDVLEFRLESGDRGKL